VNARVDRYEVDFLWPGKQVIVETDGFRFHGSRAAFESDRARDATLNALGYRVLRFTYRQLLDSPKSAIASLRAVLA
jgi:very-short-patch-repair endonuclease